MNTVLFGYVAVSLLILAFLLRRLGRESQGWCWWIGNVCMSLSIVIGFCLPPVIAYDLGVTLSDKSVGAFATTGAVLGMAFLFNAVNNAPTRSH